ncbi:hypothetical protein OQA88_4090 [Cercophora sp. LCS_1]
MELNSASITDVIHPTAAFSQSPQRTPPASIEPPSWLESQLNPKNRIDSLDPPKHPSWRVDGCTGLATQYYVVPLFLGDIPPMRFDVFIPEEATESLLVRQLLDLNAAFHTKDADRVKRLGITTHILRTLQVWTEQGGEGAPQSIAEMYTTLPFGSRIVFENLELDIRNIRITIVPTHYIETQLLRLGNLAPSLDVPSEAIPEAIEISRLSFVQQLHDSICLVRIRPTAQGTHQEKHGEQESDRLWILKALTSGTRYLYAELQNLLRIKPHPHVISRPKYLVTKDCRFGNKIGVVGFLLHYHATGSLRDHLPLLRIHGQLTLEAQTKWAIQLASAVLHVREQGRIFYPDLRLDNIVLSDIGDIVMVDFEQRGVWCEFAAPEVNALEYIRILAVDEYAERDTEPTLQEEVRERYAGLLSKLLPDWEFLQSEQFGPLPRNYTSYNISWQCLSPTEQEAAEVYMLGRVLWCIFEGQSAPQHAAVWQSYTREPDFEFPTFKQTPPEIRDLINCCTRGRRGVLSQLVARRGSKLVLCDSNTDEVQNAAEVLRVAREWWTAEVKVAEDFLQMRLQRIQEGRWDGNYYDRPSLRDVVATLEQFRANL